ncbi:MAG: hypothetical protein JHC26_01270, partial [Thermofilum sp.]|uniref:hypothetical protein n=1 Tax=Thermofilum sp. TaxID=1961369 RepID=UPI00258BC8A1
MIRLIIEPAIIDQRIDHIVNWVTGWLYRNGYAFYSKEYDYRSEWDVEIYVKRLEPVSDIFGFVIDEFGDAFRHFINEVDAEIEAVVVCNEDETECFDVWLSDLENLDKQEFLEIEERWQRMIEPMIYGEDDDPEYREYLEANSDGLEFVEEVDEEEDGEEGSMKATYGEEHDCGTWARCGGEDEEMDRKEREDLLAAEC